MREVTFSFCRWRKLSTHVKSAMGKQRLLHINSANCPGIYTKSVESEMQEKLSLIVTGRLIEDNYFVISDGSFLPSECSSYTWNGTASMLSCLWTASWASRWWFPDTWPCCPTALNPHDPLLASAGVPKPPCKTSKHPQIKYMNITLNMSHLG